MFLFTVTALKASSAAGHNLETGVESVETKDRIERQKIFDLDSAEWPETQLQMNVNLCK